MHKMFTRFFGTVALLLLLPVCGAWAQKFEWVQQLATPGCGYYPGCTADKAGNSFFYGTFCDSLAVGGKVYKATRKNFSDAVLVKYSSTGDVVWSKFLSTPMQDYAYQCVADQQGCLYVLMGGADSITIDGKAYLVREGYYEYLLKFDPQGNLLLFKPLYNMMEALPGHLFIDYENNFYVTGWFDDSLTMDGVTITESGREQSFIAKYNKSGRLLWLRRSGGSSKPSLAFDRSGGIYATGSFHKAAQFDDVILELGRPVSHDAIDSYLCKYDRNGKAMWATKLGEATQSVLSSFISTDGKGNIYVAGYFGGQLTINGNALMGGTGDNRDTFLAQFDPAGKPVWGKKIGGVGTDQATGVFADASEDVFLVHETGQIIGTTNLPAAEIGLFVTKYGRNGEQKWSEHVPGYGLGYAKAAADPKGNFYLTGFLYENPVFGGDTLHEVKTSGEAMFMTKLVDTTFTPNPTPNRIAGNVYHDANANCKRDVGEEALADQIIKVEPGPYYTATDSVGNYSVFVDKGTYTVQQVLPPDEKHRQISQLCPAPATAYSVTFNAYGKDTAGFHFGNQVMRLPFLKVDVAADRRRRCFRGTTTVRYCNEGYAAAQNVRVQVYYPQYVVPLGANVPWQKRDSLLTFTIGTLAPGACGVISIADSVICGNEAIRGLTQCVRAVITPGNDNQPPDPRWDRSDVVLQAACRNNGLVKLTLLNAGTGNMAAPAGYRIYLDAVKVHEGPYQLGSGDSLSLQVPANGRTVRLEADLSPYHPDGDRRPSITLEGCGTANATISKGFADQLPPDDAGEEVSVSCLPILDSYDPNDKQATPAGAGPGRLIAPQQALEYLVRFQNTGSDVAYLVVIEDTLDANLDVATLEIGAASHPFSWSVSGVGRPVLTWTFKNINLPDSTTNEPASHGYVRFRIRPKADTPLGTPIGNLAAITFDYNSPILTNVVTHTTGELPAATGEAGVDVCSGNYPTAASAGPDAVLDGASAATLQGNLPGKGFGYWQLKSGKGTLTNPTDPASQVTGLGVGKNVFAWNIALCDTTSTSLVTLERVVVPAPPLVNPPAPYCAGEPVAAVTATGAGLRWYADRSLANQLGAGERYQPPTGRSDTVYVTQTVDGYQSLPAAVRIAVKPPVPAPRVDSVGYFCNGTLLQPVNATGENIRWYGDAGQTRLLHEGETFGLSNPATGILYVTQIVNGCRSKAATVALREGGGDLKRAVWVPNVITPNGDGYNDAFETPAFAPGACIGTFRTVHIYNRWGKPVFSSADPHFAWRAGDCPGGMYFFEIRYSNFSLRGGLSVLR